MSIIDILEGRDNMAFWHMKFTESEVQDAFKLLRDEGMLRPITFSLNGELRYDVYDPSVKMFLEDCWKLYKLVYVITDVIWNKIRPLTTDEIKWVEGHSGTQTADKLRLYLKKDWLKITEHNNEIKRYTEHLTKEYAEVIIKYQFPFDDLLEVIYPKCLQQLASPVK